MGHGMIFFSKDHHHHPPARVVLLCRFLLLCQFVVQIQYALWFVKAQDTAALQLADCQPQICTRREFSYNRTLNVTYPFGVKPGCGASPAFLFSGCNDSINHDPVWDGFDQFYTENTTAPRRPYAMRIQYGDSTAGRISSINITWNDSVILNRNASSCFTSPLPAASDNSMENMPDATIDLSGSPFRVSNATSVLLFDCTKTAQYNASFTKDSSLCRSYNKNCSISPKQCIEWKPITTFNVKKTMNQYNCTNFQLLTSGYFSIEGNWKEGVMQLEWNGTDLPNYDHCTSDCQTSGGACGYTNSTAFQCLCPEGQAALPNSTCAAVIPGAQSASGNNSKPLIAAVVAAIVALIVVALVLSFYFLIRRRHRFKKFQSDPRSIPTSNSSSKLWTERANMLSRKFGPVHVKEFPYEELMRATNSFADENLIGDGGFGAVFVGVLKDGSKVAIKRLYHDNFRRMDQFYNEMKILSELSHMNLVKLYGFCCEDDKDLLLVFEYASNGTVSDKLHGDSKSYNMPWKVRLSIACETAEALRYLHNDVSPPIYHRDVKTTNILLDDNYHAKLADFGLSRLVPLEVTHVSTAPQGTPGYVDPEYHTCYQLTDKSDVFSFGVVLTELVSGKLAVDMTRSKKEINLSSLALSKITLGAQDELMDPALEMEKHSEDLKSVKAVIELTFRCLQPEKDDRPTMKEVAEILTQIQGYYTGCVQEGINKKTNVSHDQYNCKSDLSLTPSPADETSKLMKVKSDANSADSGYSSIWTNSNPSLSY